MKPRDASFTENLHALFTTEPFEPFRIQLVNGVFYDIFHPQNAFLTDSVVNIHSPDQNWVFFPINKIASVESLIADYQGQPIS